MVDEVIFHVGMGKTGTTTIQKALGAATETLTAAGISYQGMWQPLVSPDYVGWVGFQTFRLLPPEDLVRAADTVAQGLTDIARASSTTRFIFSNEQYFENVDRMAPFFDRLAQSVPLKILIWVRPVQSWLPSACAQWGIVHKTNRGDVQSFADQADRLIGQYAHLPKWLRLFGDKVTVRRFDDRTDPVADLSRLIGVDLPSSAARHQTRPDPSELLLRAAFNTQFAEMVLPDAFNAAMGRHRALPGAGQGLSGRADAILGRDAMEGVIARHAPLLAAATEAAGFDVTGDATASTHLSDREAIIDGVLGRAIEVIAGQARDIEDLRRRIAELEGRAADGPATSA